MAKVAETATGARVNQHTPYCCRYRRQGISTELRRQSLGLARQRGCQAAIDSATSPYTRKALVKLGFRQEKFLPFRESLLADVGKVDLSECGPNDGAALMICRL